MGGYYDAESTVTWFPRQRIDGVRAALRARKHVRWGRFASAEADLTTAVKLAPHYTGARQRLAELLIRGDAVERLGRLLPLARANGFGSDTSFVLPEELDGLAPRIELPPPVTGWWPVGWDEPLTEEPNTLPVDECTNAPPAPAPWPAPPPEIFFAALTLPPLAPVQGGVPTWLALGWLAGAAWLLGRRIRVPGRWAEPWQHLSFDWRLWRVVRRGPRSK